jgi:hypothetical protein
MGALRPLHLSAAALVALSSFPLFTEESGAERGFALVAPIGPRNSSGVCRTVWLYGRGEEKRPNASREGEKAGEQPEKAAECACSRLGVPTPLAPPSSEHPLQRYSGIAGRRHVEAARRAQTDLVSLFFPSQFPRERSQSRVQQVHQGSLQLQAKPRLHRLEHHCRHQARTPP